MSGPGLIHVMHLIGSLEPAGAEHALLELVRHLPRSIRSTVVVWGPPLTLQPDFEAAGVRVIDLEGRSRMDLRAWHKLRRLLRQEHIQILHTHLMRMHVVGHLVLGRASRIRQISSHHSVAASNSILLRLLERATRRSTGIHVSVSECVERSYFGSTQPFSPSLIKMGGYHCTIHDGVAIPDETPLRARAEETQRFRFVCVGRLHAVKGHRVLLKAMQIVGRRLPDVKLQIVGEGPERTRLERAIHDLGLEGVVELTGHRNDRNALLADADALVCASFFEGFGLAVAEAMATGLPIVSTRVGAVPELVQHGVSGYLVTPGDVEGLANAMCKLAEDPKCAVAMGVRGYERVSSHFTIEKNAGQISALYETFMAIQPDAGHSDEI